MTWVVVVGSRLIGFALCLAVVRLALHITYRKYHVLRLSRRERLTLTTLRTRNNPITRCELSRLTKLDLPTQLLVMESLTARNPVSRNRDDEYRITYTGVNVLDCMEALEAALR